QFVRSMKPRPVGSTCVGGRSRRACQGPLAANRCRLLSLEFGYHALQRLHDGIDVLTIDEFDQPVDAGADFLPVKGGRLTYEDLWVGGLANDLILQAEFLVEFFP